MQWINGCLARGISAGLSGWTSTLDLRVHYQDIAADPGLPGYTGQAIFVFWHEYILLPLAFRGHCNLAMLVSRHKDAELLAQVGKRMGFDFVRGSTNRGGISAVREIMERCRGMNLAITPDGPRGPRRQMAPGPVYLASKLGIPVVPLGISCHRPWRMPSWDRFAVPRPFSRVRCVLGTRHYYPPDLERDALETHRVQLEQTLNGLCDSADRWAAGQEELTPQLPGRVPAAIAELERNRAVWAKAGYQSVAELSANSGAQSHAA